MPISLSISGLTNNHLSVIFPSHKPKLWLDHWELWIPKPISSERKRIRQGPTERNTSSIAKTSLGASRWMKKKSWGSSGDSSPNGCAASAAEKWKVILWMQTTTRLSACRRRSTTTKKVLKELTKFHTIISTRSSFWSTKHTLPISKVKRWRRNRKKEMPWVKNKCHKTQTIPVCLTKQVLILTWTQ